MIGAISPILMRTNINRFDFLKYPSVVFLSSLGFLTYYFNISVTISSTLIFFYCIVVSGGILLFMRKYDFVKSLSLSIALGFAASGIWELPIFLYTIAYRGYISGAAPLHISYIIPLLLLMSDIRIEVSRKNVLIFVSMMVFNFLMLAFHITLYGPNIWIVRGIDKNILLWLSRPVTAILLFTIYYGGKMKRV